MAENKTIEQDGTATEDVERGDFLAYTAGLNTTEHETDSMFAAKKDGCITLPAGLTIEELDDLEAIPIMADFDLNAAPIGSLKLKRSTLDAAAEIARELGAGLVLHPTLYVCDGRAKIVSLTIGYEPTAEERTA